MSIKDIVSVQYQEIIDCASDQVQEISLPPEGWLCTARKSLKMSGAQLARRLGVSRAQVSKTEKNELPGSVTIKTMQHMAEAMGYRFVYAIVPEKTVKDVIEARARKKATAIVERTNKHMALEGQTLSSQQIQFEIERLQKDMMDRQPSDFWDDEK
ncbi:HigA protein (antitoxin to HigB) [hydrothermal vent metagenome]|uniref:HigA protein (Antitoxin to HigB) n=1 Tax=hydrothermal vent metagenome TaxID=652676 RepID=A0A3B1A1N5_9ZZZZ